MDLSQLSTEDLQALSGGDMSKVSEAGLRTLSGAPVSAKPPDTSMGHMALGAAEQAGSAVANLPHAAAHAVADLYNRITGNAGALDPKIVQALHVPVGQAGEDFSNTAGNALTSLIDKSGLGGAATAGAGAAHSYMNDQPTSGLQAVVQATAPAVSDIATLAGLKGAPGVIARAPGEIAGAVSGARSLMSGSGFDVPEGVQPEDVGLTKPNNPPLTPRQQISNTVAHAEAGSTAPTSQITPESLKAARAAPSGVIRRAANTTPDGPVDQQTLDEVANAGGNGVPVSGQGSIHNIQSLRDNLRTILSSDTLTGDQKVDWLQALRTKGYKNVGSQDVGAQELGEAQLDAAHALEGHIERNLPENGDVNIDQFRDARTALAKNHTVESVLKGNDVDLAALGRIYQRNPNLLTGGLGMLGKYAAENSDVAGLGGRFQEPIDLKQVDLTKPATWFSPLTGAAKRVMANRQAAAGTEAAQAAFQQNPGRFAPLEPQAPQPPLGMTASTPMAPPSAPAGPGGGFSLADLLSHGVEQPPPAGLSAGPMGLGQELGGMPFSGSPEAVGARPVQGGAPPMARRFPDDFGNEVNPNAEPHAPLVLGQRLAGPQEGLGTDLAKVASQGVPEGTATRTAPEPKVTHEVDENTGTHIVTSKNGETHAQESGPYLLVKRTDTAKGAQGTGEGTARMEALIQQAESRGKTLGSDVSVSPAQARVYDRLKRMGYSVVKNDSSINPTTKNLVSSDPRVPVFEVSSPLGRALASSQ